MLSNLFKRFKSFLDSTQREKQLRENLKRNFENQDSSSELSSAIDARNQSMRDSQGVSTFSGSGHNSPGKADSSKKIYNKPRHDFLKT